MSVTVRVWERSQIGLLHHSAIGGSHALAYVESDISDCRNPAQVVESDHVWPVTGHVGPASLIIRAERLHHFAGTQRGKHSACTTDVANAATDTW